MKKLILPALCMLTLAACNKQPDNAGTTDVISITDNGITYRDTITVQTGGHIIARESEQTKPVITEGTGTEHFVSSTDKQLSASNYNIYACMIHKVEGHTFFTLLYNNPSSRFPLSFDIGATGPVNGGVGTYSVSGITDSMVKIERPDTTGGVVLGNTFTETINGTQQYRIDSAVVNVTKASATAIEADFQMWLSNSSGKKTVTGHINSNNANTVCNAPKSGTKAGNVFFKTP